MTRGQFFTLITLGIALAVTSAGITLALTILVSRPLYWQIVYAVAPDADRIAPLWMASIVAGSAMLASYGLVRVQQSLTVWAANKEIARLHSECSEIERAHGIDAANRYLETRLARISDPFAWDPFGKVAAMHAMKAAGVGRET